VTGNADYVIFSGMKKALKQFLTSIMPFIGMGIFLVLLVAGLVIFSYLLIFGAVVGLVLFTIFWIYNKLTGPAKIKTR